MPLVLASVAHKARLAGAGQTDEVATVRHAAALRGWLRLDASLFDERDAGRVAIIVGASREPEVASLIAEAYRLSKRELEVTGLVLRGRSTDEIAEQLHVSAYTVQDHLKSIFEKVGVRSRRELVAQLFFQQSAPRLSEAAPLRSDGWFSDAVLQLGPATDACRAPAVRPPSVGSPTVRTMTSVAADLPRRSSCLRSGSGEIEARGPSPKRTMVPRRSSRAPGTVATAPGRSGPSPRAPRAGSGTPCPGRRPPSPMASSRLVASACSAVHSEWSLPVTNTVGQRIAASRGVRSGRSSEIDTIALASARRSMRAQAVEHQRDRLGVVRRGSWATAGRRGSRSRGSPPCPTTR